MQGADARMRKLRNGFRFALLPRVPCPIHLSHPAGTKSYTVPVLFLPLGSFIQLCCPVQYDRHRCAPCLLQFRIDQESLPVSAHVINEEVIDRDWLPRSHLEKCKWRAGIEIGPGRYWRGHNLAV